MLKKTLSIVALLTMVAGCQYDTPVRTWNSPETNQSQAEGQDYSSEQMPSENLSSETSTLEMHPSVMGSPVGSYKIGKTYNVDGMEYTPSENYGYQAEGMSSWYGSEFAGQKTANGAIFNPQAYTAAHKTLPLPSVIKVTNLDNGKTTYARVNDRGPFTKNRLVDVSEAVAEELGMKVNGTARMKVELMEAESKQLKERAMANGTVQTSMPAQPSGLSQSEMMPSQPVISNGYFVQAGALASNANAESMRSQINSVGNSLVVNEGGYYKVRVGPFQTMDQAIQAKNSLQQYGISNPGLIKDGKWSKW